MRVTFARGGEEMVAVTDYGVSKDGVLFGRIAKVEKKGTNEGPTEGELFSFQFTVAGDKLTISDLKTSSGGGDAKQLVEGDYKKAAN
jgi:hypothetical protein